MACRCRADWSASVPLASHIEMSIDYNFQPKGLKSDHGWYSRGYLPHFDGGQIPQFFTFRIFDSVPALVIERWKEKVKDLGPEGQTIFRKRVEKFMDAGHGACFLKVPEVAQLVADSLKFHNGSKYRLHSWVVMPNHAHFLATPNRDVEIREIAHSIKSFTAHEANKILARKGQFWQQEPFDRYIRNARHFAAVIRYIENNPVKAGLCEMPHEWRYSSAFQHIPVIVT